MSTFFIQGCASDSDVSIQYFENINSSIEEIIILDDKIQHSILSFLETNENNSENLQVSDSILIEKLDKMIENLKQRLIINRLKLEKIEVFNKELSLKRSAINFIDNYSKVMENEIKVIRNILNIPFENFTDKDEIQLNNVLDQFNEKLNNSLNTYYFEVQIFAKKYDLDINIEN